MALIFMESFDKYGPANSNSTAVAAMLTAGEWTSIAGAAQQIVAPLSATGQAFSVGPAGSVTKTITAVARIIGGMRFSSNLANVAGIQFLDAAANQCGIVININGTIQLRNGIYSSGTVIATSAGSITASSVHYLEWDISLGNASAYQVWLDGVSLFSGTGDTTATVNNTISGFSVIQTVTTSYTVDDIYLFDTTGTINNAVLLTSPRIETQFPTSDGAVQFAVGAATLGNGIGRGGANYAGTANSLYVRAYTPSRNCTLNSLSVLPVQTNGAVNLRPVVYADNAGVPNGGALLSAGSTVTGQTISVMITLSLTTPVSLTAGTQYWLGFMQDVTSANMTGQDNSVVGRAASAVTFASGAPATCPTTTGGWITVVVYGNITNTGVNWYEVASQPPQGASSYVFDATIGHEDLYSFPALSAPPSAIYAVAVKASLSKSDAGAKTASIRLKSGATDSAGTGGTALAPGTSYGWMTSHYPTDPATSAAWTLGGLNSAQAGVKVET